MELGNVHLYWTVRVKLVVGCRAAPVAITVTVDTVAFEPD